MSHSTDVVAALAEDEANIYDGDPDRLPIPTYNIFKRLRLAEALNEVQKPLECNYLLDRTYEGVHWHFLTFKPFNKNYDPLYSPQKLMDHVRKKLGKRSDVPVAIITRETMATKIHYNVLLGSYQDLEDKLDGAHTNRYYIYCKKIDSSDRKKVYNYIVKETKKREFQIGVDYHYWG